ncbi:unnamed protein product [Rhizophagus irregularis]|uniref:Uncharacterized protein n=1 Tax=Rhizophagus irregularis TaxID=588596 RepID=A0A915YTI7_9GLOM|nr:unnamed protein product [Rhizophagus irregularis]CAB5330774.1 unnamed protein product [Rhizophagus irregularis]
MIDYIKKHSNVSFSFFVGFIEIGHLVLVSIIRVRVLTFETGPRKKIIVNNMQNSFYNFLRGYRSEYLRLETGSDTRDEL